MRLVDEEWQIDGEGSRWPAGHNKPHLCVVSGLRDCCACVRGACSYAIANMPQDGDGGAVICERSACCEGWQRRAVTRGPPGAKALQCPTRIHFVVQRVRAPHGCVVRAKRAPTTPRGRQQ